MAASSSSIFSSCEFSTSITATSSLISSLSTAPSERSSSDSVALHTQRSLLFSISGTRLTVRDGNSLAVLFTFNCVDKIDSMALSPDKQFVLAAMHARGVVEVFSLTDPEWRCRINEGSAGAGFVLAAWAPDSAHILTQSDFGIQLTVWSLVDSSSVVISSPKQIDSEDSNGAMNQSFAFSDCGKYLAVLHRLDLQDYIGVYSTNPWEELTKFRCQTSDACYIQWLPGGLHIIALDSPIYYKVNVFTPSGQIVSCLEAYEHALGVRSVAFQPLKRSAICTPLMAVSSFDGKIRVLSTKSWQVAYVLSCAHPRDMESTLLPACGHESVSKLITIEESTWVLGSGQSLLGGDENSITDSTFNISFTAKSAATKSSQPSKSSRQPSAYVQKNIKTLPSVSVDPLKAKGHIAMGVQWAGFSSDAAFLAARDEAHPRCLWIWDMKDVKINQVVVQLDNITSAAWRPASSDGSDPAILAFCCGSARVYLWSNSTGVSWSDIPAGLAPFSVVSLKWSEDGSQLILSGKEVFCTCSLSFDVGEERNASQHAVHDTTLLTDNPSVLA